MVANLSLIWPNKDQASLKQKVSSQQTFVLMKTSWRRLEDVFHIHLQKTSWSRRTYSLYSYVFRRRLDQDQYIRLGHTSSRRSHDFFKTSTRRLAKMSSKRLQDVFKTSSRRLKTSCYDVFKTSCKNIFKTSSRRLQDVLIKTDIFAILIRLQKTSWTRPIYPAWSYVFKTFSRLLQDVFKTTCQDVFKTSSRRLQVV